LSESPILSAKVKVTQRSQPGQGQRFMDHVGEI